jgi:mono/diheme cytochrome c family protein
MLRTDRSPESTWQAGAPRAVGVAACLLATLALAGCRQDMHQAPRYDPLERSEFFADQRSARPMIPGTVARGFLREDARYYTGRDGNVFVQRMPLEATLELVQRGQERYNVFCAPCHARTGEGDGPIVQRGMKQPPSFHSERLRQQPDGYFYDVITNGFGAMQDYASQIAPADRWAVVAYLRALQLSRSTTVDDVPEAERERLEGVAPAEGGPTTHE